MATYPGKYMALGLMSGNIRFDSSADDMSSGVKAKRVAYDGPTNVGWMSELGSYAYGPELRVKVVAYRRASSEDEGTSQPVRFFVEPCANGTYLADDMFVIYYHRPGRTLAQSFVICLCDANVFSGGGGV